jgi:hypothetical protein
MCWAARRRSASLTWLLLVLNCSSQSPSTTFRFLEGEFKQGLPVVVSNDYPPTAGGRLVH